ncbi:aldehyde dehydrogenase [Fulvitalea axinellae]|uniref:Aldehyde dehydrogenase n=1 Tax=Fulvitalea axinellae TaxID=1182444 RepID=A0AAU9D3Q9_9BACT|nr:aldehyde dehydrogenase [Fulvitalea axinellae]
MTNQTQSSVAEDVKVYKQFINGEFVDTNSGSYYDVINPCTEEVLSQVANGDAEDARLALEAARNSQDAWAKLAACERAGYLKEMARITRENRVELATILAKEQAKILPLAQVEIDVTAEYFDYNAGWARRVEGEIIQSDNPKENIYLYKMPIGVTVGICPWNFPFFVMARKVAPALVTGNTSVIKPSSFAPNTIMRFVELIQGIGLPKGVLNVICGWGSDCGHALASSPITGLVSLTGSVEAGEKVMAACAPNITKVNLELGGKAPAIVCEDADLELAVTAIVNSRVIYSGQVCNCAERVYVHEDVYEQFMEMLVKRMSEVKVGDALAEDTPDMSSQISLQQLEKIEAMVARAVEEGCEVLTGGARDDRFETGFFFQPTVLANCRQEMEVIQKEVFGPVLPVVKVKDFDEAIALANDSEYGLTSSVYTQDANKAMKAVNEIKFGETYINRHNFEAIQGFHAGWRKSGIGGADGKHGMEEYLQTRMIYWERH